jgi:serine/threonine protein kinase
VIGKLLNQYRIEEVVGQGGMGVVYRALDMNLERTVAVKVLSASFREDPEFIERFRQEARIQAGLNHPNIATLFDFFVWNDMPVAVMEFIKGETLRSMVDRSGPIPAHVVLPIFVQALRGVAAGHKRRIIHRDLKPSNLMITDEGIVKITDFGIAKVRSATGHTQESTRVGSVRYMAPEQILGRPVDVQTDVYIMGGTLYELLTGRPPFQGINQFEIDSAHVRDPPKEPTAYCPNIPPAAVDAIMRALAKEPSERFASAEEFIQALPDLHGVPYVATVTVTGDETRQQQGAPKALPDLRGVPHIATGTPTGDETRQQQNIPEVAHARRPGTASTDETLLQQNVAEAASARGARTTSLDEPQPQPNASKAAHARRVGTAIAAGGLLVLSIVGVVRYSQRQADVGPGHGRRPALAEESGPTPQTQLTAPTNTTVATSPNTTVTTSPNTRVATPPSTAVNAPPNTQLIDPPNTDGITPPNAAVTASLTTDPKPAEQVTPAISPTLKYSRDLTGMWTGTYRDRSGRAQLQLLNLQMQQVSDGAITGRLTYKAGSSGGEECTLDKSNYSAQSKRLRLIIHCRNPKHPKYLNVPLEFIDVDPRAGSIQGGRLAFHLADDIVVTLERTKGI